MDKTLFTLVFLFLIFLCITIYKFVRNEERKQSIEDKKYKKKHNESNT
jgi:hypothetical protein